MTESDLPPLQPAKSIDPVQERISSLHDSPVAARELYAS